MIRKSRFVRFVLVGGFVTFLISTFLPIWTVWHMYEWEGVGHHRSLWLAIWEIAQSPADDVDAIYLTGDPIDLLKLAIALIVGAVLGTLGYVVWPLDQSRHS
jgi:hypothetical protein